MNVKNTYWNGTNGVLAVSQNNIENVMSQLVEVGDKKHIVDQELRLALIFTQIAHHSDHRSLFNVSKFLVLRALFFDPLLALYRAAWIIQHENDVGGIFQQLANTAHQLQFV